MVPNQRTGGFVPSYVHKTISKSNAVSPEAQKSAAATLQFDQARVATGGAQDPQRGNQNWNAEQDAAAAPEREGNTAGDDQASNESNDRKGGK